MKYRTHVSSLGLFLIALTTLAGLCSCGSDPTDPGNRLSGVIRGEVELYDQYGDPESDKSGVVVEVEGTSYKTTSGADGRWQLSDIPAGIYVISIHKDGYTNRKYFGYQFVGGGEAFFAGVQLFHLAPFQITSFEANYYDTATVRTYIVVEDPITKKSWDSAVYRLANVDPYLLITGTIDHAVPADKQVAVRLYLSRNPNVSKEEGMYDYTRDLVFSNGTSFKLQANVWLRSAGVVAGERIYIVAYPNASGNHSESYYDPNQQKEVYTGVTNTPSNVVSVVAQ